MPKKKWTEQERAAFAAKMKAARAAKKEPEETISQNDDLIALKKRIEELESKQFFTQPVIPSTKQVITKFSFDPKVYPDPRSRLAAEDKLKRFAFSENYELDWQVQKVDYEEDGLKVRAPRFILDLIGKVIDKETNEIVKKYDPATKQWVEQRYILKKLMMFEDPDSFIVVANQMGIDVPEFLEKPFLDEMRYMVMRDWLIEQFTPPKRTVESSEKETVIDNRLVKVYEKAVEIGEPQPEFSELRG